MDDTEYKNFLYQCYRSPVELGNDTNTEDDDPTYVHNDDIFSHGYKFDLDEALVDESSNYDINQVQNSYDDNLAPYHSIIDEFNNKQPSFDIKSPSKRRKLDIFSDPDFAKILNLQLRQHIQLLTQTYLLTKNTTNMKSYAEEAREHLNSYKKIFKNKSKPSNLMAALELVNNLPVPKELQSSIRLSWRHLPIPDSVRKTLARHPTIFIYKNLLPQVAFSLLPEKLIPKKSKINFTINEDKLLAYALNEFKGEHSQYAFIASLLMTAKTKMQISNHIKNIKRSPGNDDSPLKLYLTQNELPEIDLYDDVDRKDTSEQQLDDLMAASTTITKSITSSTNSENKSLKNLRLRKSMLSLMSRKFTLSREMGDKMIQDFLRSCQDKLSDKNFMRLLQLMTNNANNKVANGTTLDTSGTNDSAVRVYREICEFLVSIRAPNELKDKLVLFLNFDQASKCGCALNYLYWMRFFQFMQHIELHHDGEAFEKKIARLVDALQKDDPHKLKLAAANLVNKHPLLKRDFDALSLDGKPHASLFMCDEDFDDITEPLSTIDNCNTHCPSHSFECFQLKPSKEEIHYATQNCPCACHAINGSASTRDQNASVSAAGAPNGSAQLREKAPLGKHCDECNLKFIKGKMYLVNKIKPILAKWYYTTSGKTCAATSGSPSSSASAAQKQQHQPAAAAAASEQAQASEWTFEEDKEILEFCQAKAEQNEETVSFDSSTFEEFVQKRRHSSGGHTLAICKKSARQIAERFNQLMELYKMDENSGLATGL